MLRYSTALLFLHAALAAAAYTAVDDSNLDAAVMEWFTSPGGGATFGPIAGWDVTAVTTWSDFLKKSATAQRSPAPRTPRPAPSHHALLRQVDPNRGPGGRDL